MPAQHHRRILCKVDVHYEACDQSDDTANTASQGIPGPGVLIRYRHKVFDQLLCIAAGMLDPSRGMIANFVRG